jgi:hypothetical protein
MIFDPLPRFVLPTPAPPCSWRQAPIDEGFLQIQMAFVVEGMGEHFQDPPQHARANPLLKPAVAGLIREIAVRQVSPRGSGSEDPRDAIEHGAVLPPRAAPAVFAARQLGQGGPNQNPLLVGKVTGMRRGKNDHPGQSGPAAIRLLAPTQKIDRQIGVNQD